MKDLSPKTITVTLNELIGKIVFKKSALIAFGAAFFLAFVSSLLSKFS